MIRGPGLPSSSNAAIGIGIGAEGHSNVQVRNGCLNGWNAGVNDGLGSYGNRALNLRTINCLNGIRFGGYGSNQIKGCTFLSPSSQSVGYGIYCPSGVVTGNTVVTVGNSYGIYINAADPCLVTQNAVMGPGTRFHSGGSGTVNVNNAGF